MVRQPVVLVHIEFSMVYPGRQAHVPLATVKKELFEQLRHVKVVVFP